MGGKNASNPVESIAGIQAIFKYFQDIPAKDLKGITDDLKKTISSGIVVVTSTYEDKVSLVVGVTHDLTPTISAVDWQRLLHKPLVAKEAEAVRTWPKQAGRILKQLQKYKER